MIQQSPTLADSFGFCVQDSSRPGSRAFWATIIGQAQIPYTIKADRADMEDYALCLMDDDNHMEPKRFLSSLSTESWDRFVYLFSDHLLNHRCQPSQGKLTIMGHIFEIIHRDASEPVTEYYSHLDFKVAGHTLCIYARRVGDGHNYSNEWGQYRAWIESPSITDLESLLKVYSDIVVNYTVRGSLN